ncbi:hypothetical protein ACN4EG_01390 [Alkalinema pantanalense CENA528]
MLYGVIDAKLGARPLTRNDRVYPEGQSLHLSLAVHPLFFDICYGT